jgi:5-methylcytosine-specific restriction endonuclease McrA
VPGDGVRLHVDHVKPWSKDGETVLENLQILCNVCNIGKGDVELETDN